MNTRDFLDLLKSAGSTVTGPNSTPRPLSHYIFEAEQRANRWSRSGVPAESLIVLHGLAGIPLLEAILSAWCLQAVPFPCEDFSAQQLPGPAFKLTAESFEKIETPDQHPRLREAAVLHRTSGSTGEARLVIRSSDTLTAEARRYQQAHGLGTSDRLLVVLPIDHSFGWGFLLGGLLSGCQVDLRSRFSPVKTARQIDSGNVSVTALTPAMAHLVVRCAGAKPPNPPRWVIVGAGPVDDLLEESFDRRFGVGLARNYGSTETGAVFCGDSRIGSGVIGQPMFGITVLSPAAGETGELIIHADPEVDGYLDGEKSARWATGDLVERDLSGRVRVFSRLDHKLRVNGQTLDRARIESCVLAYPGLTKVYLLAFPREGARQVEDLVAVVTSSRISEGELIRYCACHLPPSHCPTRVVSCDELPRTSLGKIDRKKIVSLVASSV